MSRIRSLLARVQRLEQLKNPRSPIELMFSSLEVFEAHVQQGVNARRLCHMDAPVLIHIIRRWHRDDAWSMWGRRGQVWTYGGQR